VRRLAYEARIGGETIEVRWPIRWDEAYGGRVDSGWPAKGDVMLNLNTVMICSEDPQALSAFYTKVLGEPGWQDSGYIGWQAGSAMLMIGPHSEVKGRNEMPGRIIVNFETPDVQGEFERIKGLGARVEHEPYQPGDGAEMWLATFEDPDGNFFQLASPMPAP
jgi:predicted enzyme related to lactoylglutathione lyase